MQGAFKIQNEPLAMKEAVPTEGIFTLTGTGDIEPLTADPTKYFQKLWIYPGKAVNGATGALTANVAAVRVGKSGAAATKYLPDVLNPTDLPLKYEVPLGQKMRLAQVLVSGTVGDGVMFSYT